MSKTEYNLRMFRATFWFNVWNLINWFGFNPGVEIKWFGWIVSQTGFMYSFPYSEQFPKAR